MTWIQNVRTPATPPAGMAAALLSPFHLRTSAFGPDRAGERCLRPGCRVGPDGRADCGSVACPACGLGGSNLTAPDGFDGDQLLRCACGYAWIRPAGAP